MKRAPVPENVVIFAVDQVDDEKKRVCCSGPGKGGEVKHMVLCDRDRMLREVTCS
jgi:hypothetical protein